MKPVNLIVTLTLLFLFSCDDESSKTVGPSKTGKIPDKATGPVDVSGVVIEESSQEPIENVEIISFSGGVYYGSLGPYYGTPVRLGATDNCGRFNIKLPDIIRGFGPHGSQNLTIVMLRLSRSDVGMIEVTIPFEPGSQTFSIRYSPTPVPFFNSLYLVQSEDGKSIDIGWKIHSLMYLYGCPQVGGPDICASQSDGNLYIQRSDSSGFRYIIPIEVNNHQMVTDRDLPVGNFSYRIYPGDNRITDYTSDVIRKNADTLFLVKPLKFPTLNHCN